MMDKNRITVLDGWRGMAILLVLIGHFFDLKWIWEDRLGVDVFFVLSGMLMSTILFEKRIHLRDFYIRRFSRIIPAFTLYVIVAYVFASLAGYSFESREVGSTLVFFRTYYPLEPHIWASDVPIDNLWTLNVEEHGYLIMSFIAIVFLRKTNIAYLLTALGLISIAICFYYYNNEALAPTQFRIRTESTVSFIFLSAGYNLWKKQYNIRVHEYLPVASFLLAVICYFTVMPDWLSFSFAPVLLAFSLNHITEAHAFFRNLLSSTIFRLMGIWSYSIYLWQQPFYEYAWVIPGGNLIALIIGITVGILSFYFFEDPIRYWINNRWTKEVKYKVAPEV